MTSFYDIVLSGWFQLVALSVAFWFYSRRVWRAEMQRGYVLGWLLALFCIFVYGSLNPPQGFNLRNVDVTLSVFQVAFVSFIGLLFGSSIGLAALLLPDSYRRRALTVALLSAVFVVALFFQVIASSDVRLMVSLFLLALGIAQLTGIVLTRRRAPDSRQASAQTRGDTDPAAFDRNPFDMDVPDEVSSHPLQPAGALMRTNAVSHKLAGRKRINRIASRYDNRPLQD